MSLNPWGLFFFFFFTSRVEASGCGTNDEPIHYHYKHLQAAQTTMEVMHTLRFKSLKCCRAYREFIVFENHKPCRKMWMNFVCIYTWHINGRYTIERLTMTYSQWPPLTSARTTLRKCLPSPCEWHMHDMLASNECSMQNNLVPDIFRCNNTVARHEQWYCHSYPASVSF